MGGRKGADRSLGHVFPFTAAGGSASNTQSQLLTSSARSWPVGGTPSQALTLNRMRGFEHVGN